MGIVEFLEARIAEDEAVAKASTPGPWEWLDDKLTTTAGQWMSCRYRCIWREPSAVNRGPVGIPGHEHFRVNETVIDSSGDYGYESEIEISDPDAAHIARHDPVRILREVAAKRKIIELHFESNSGMAYNKLDSDFKVIGQTRPCEGCGYDSCDYLVTDINDCPELQALAAIYSSHPDFNEEWRP
ncbi:DUF6221 family protein [Rhodococcus qingshengii]|uniref:DUF6221 family protein n=1 Tax=Rhodococcus qingshengii TaxID=334542 RepID=UPI0024BA2596|nr:DUF6221 family protein [Rhodococcus qingshengii]MDJ0489131.1 DUF6221 family protein [Rhodococcus qingshengii]